MVYSIGRGINSRTLALTFLLAAASTGAAGEKKHEGSTSRTTGPPSLQEQLDARKAEFEKTAPPEVVKTFQEGVEEVRASGVTDRARKVGDRAPGFELPNASGKGTRLLDLLKHGPVVLTWYRGGWCPYCNLQLRAYQKVLPEIQQHGATLVAISPETPDNSLSTKQKAALEYEVLSDVGNKVAEEYGLVYRLPEAVAARFEGMIDLEKYNGDKSNELPLSVTYVIDTNGVIRYAFIDADYRKRAEPAELIAALKELGD